MSVRLLPDQVARQVTELHRRASLTPMQAARLDAVLGTLTEDGRFLLRAALTAAEFTGSDARAQDAFQDFRKRVNEAAAQAAVELALELDIRKAPPDRRYGWFTGGDLLDEGLASFTEEKARRTGIDHPVDQAVTELVTRVYVSHPPLTGRLRRKVADLLAELRADLALDAERSWAVIDPGSVQIGEEQERVLDRLCRQADIRVALVNPSYLATDSPEWRRVRTAPSGLLPFALTGLPAGPLTLDPLRPHDIRRLDDPLDRASSTVERFARDIVAELRRALLPLPVGRPAGRSTDSVLIAASRLAAGRGRPANGECVVDADTAEISLRESQLDGTGPGAGPSTPAVDRLVSWAIDRSTRAPWLCALLGDVGMGKTTTAKLFTQRLLDLRGERAGGPLPILFDLRDVRITDLSRHMDLDHILTTMLAANRPDDVPADRLTADLVRRRVRQGDSVVVFDGLDEVLVHLSVHDQQLFTRQLWRAVDERSGSRLLLTCRTQYFRTIRDQTSYFTGEGRDGLRGRNYLALLMMPFRPEQVREYLAANLDRDAAWVDQFLATLASVHDLPDLARRPVTLRLIADQVEFIETAKLAARPLRSVDLYREFVDRWLARDIAKHHLDPPHKQLLMEEIAAELWRNNQNSWGPDQLDDWLLDLLDRRPDLQRHYREPLPDLWKADFRTSTFLARDGDTFAFGHRSLGEYFLARYLCRALTEAAPDRVPAAWAMPVPSPETLDFLGQLIAGLPESLRATALAALRRIAAGYVPLASELALGYALRARERGHPHQSLVRVQLPGARLDGWTFGADGRPERLGLTGANLAGASLRRATFRRVDLAGADLSDTDLTNTELHGSRLSGMRLAGARAAGTIVRECEIDGVGWVEARPYRAELLRCTPAPGPTPGWLVGLPQAGTGTAAPDPSTLRAFTGHTGAVLSVAWSPDGAQLLTGSTDGSVRVWDATTGHLVHYFLGHTDGVWTVAWSPDGTRLLTGSRDGSVRVWDTAGYPVDHFTGHNGPVWSVAWSPDGTRLLTGGDDRSVRVWDATTGHPIHHLTGHNDPVWSVAWSPDGTRLLTGSRDGSVRVWDATTGHPIHHLTGHNDSVLSVAWSPDGTHLLTGSDDRTVRVWDATTGHPIHHLTGHNDSVESVAWSPGGTHLLTGSGDRTVRVWDATTGHSVHHLAGHNGRVLSVAWSPDGAHLLTGSRDGSVQVWDATTGHPVHNLTGHKDRVLSVAWSPDSTHLLTGSIDGSLRVWDATTGSPMHHLTGHSDPVLSVAWSSDGNHLLTSSTDGSVRVWDATTGHPVHHITVRTDEMWSAAWSPDGTQLLTGSGDGTVRVIDVTTGYPVFHITDQTSSVMSVAWSPNGTHLLTGSTDGSARVWDAMTGHPVHHISGHTGRVWSVAWSPDGTHLLTGSGDSSARIWDATTGRLVHHLTDQTSGVLSVAWSPNGTQVLTGSFDGSVRVWDATTGHPAGFRIITLPNRELAVFDTVSQALTGASSGAWRWLGWTVVEHGRPARLPAETFGDLPPLHPAPPPAASGSLG